MASMTISGRVRVTMARVTGRAVRAPVMQLRVSN